MSDLIEAAGAWAPGDVEDGSRWRVQLDGALVDRLVEQAEALVDVPLTAVSDRVDGDVGFDEPLAAVRQTLAGPEGLGWCVVDGFEQQPLPVAERLFWLLGLALGEPVAQNRNGDLLGHVTLAAGVSGYRGYASNEALYFHSDFAPISALYCVRPAVRGGYTSLASGALVHNVLLAERPDLLATCYEPVAHGRLREEAPGMPPWSSQPIFARSGERFGMFYNPTSVRQATEYDQVPSLTPLQEEALDAIDAIARRPEVRFDFLLRSGEALFVNDHLVLHSRSRFDDADAEEEKRHLLRLWLRSPWLEESLPSSVLFDAGYG